MCRISASTTTEVPVGMRRLFFNQLMLAGVSDRGQTDGAGVTDGLSISKSVHSYLYYGSAWLPHLDEGQPWIGHVRSASKSAEISHRAAHPYRLWYTIDGVDHYMDAVHNGTIYGTGESADNEPDVDSWRAFKRLAVLMQEAQSPIPTRTIINTWIGEFGLGSRWTCMFLCDGNPTLYVARGTEPMRYMELGDGFLLNTSDIVLLNVKEWILEYWGRTFVPGKIFDVPEYSFSTIPINTVKVVSESLAKPKALPDESNKFMRITGNSAQLLKL